MKKKVEVPFCAIDTGNFYRIVHGVAHGIHRRTGNVLVTWSNGKSEQLVYEIPLRVLTAEEADELGRHGQALRVIEREWAGMRGYDEAAKEFHKKVDAARRDFQSRYTPYMVNLYKLVEEAQHVD